MKNKMQGGALIVIIVAIVIIGIFILIAVPNFQGHKRNPVARAESEMRSLKNSLESFYIDNNKYLPMSVSQPAIKTQYPDLDFENPTACRIDIAHLLIGNASAGQRLYLSTPVAYISSIPYDPFRGDGSEYSYGYGSDGESYFILTSFGPDRSEGLANVKGGELYECQYTGLNIRGSQFLLHELRYDPSNGMRSKGDIIITGP